MRRFVLLLCASAAFVRAAGLPEVRMVYVMSMAKGLDQYLANRLTNDHVFQIVTDPKMADAFLTDQIGAAFQTKMDEIFPPPEAEKPAPDTEKKVESEGDPLLSASMNKLTSPVSSFGRSRGTVFLVDAKSRQVLWSTFDPPKDFSSKQLDRAASDIVSRLKKDLSPPKK